MPWLRAYYTSVVFVVVPASKPVHAFWISLAEIWSTLQRRSKHIILDRFQISAIRNGVYINIEIA